MTTRMDATYRIHIQTLFLNLKLAWEDDLNRFCEKQRIQTLHSF